VIHVNQNIIIAVLINAWILTCYLLMNKKKIEKEKITLIKFLIRVGLIILMLFLVNLIYERKKNNNFN
tara:strand:+ start:88 stop:291 length:204 start_codon:yes stop_codon:yes gene_type:complete